MAQIKNKKMNKEFSAGTADEQTTKADNQQVSPRLHKTQCCTLLILPCGSIVKTKIGGIEGMITCQSIRFDKIQYEITYFTNNEQKCIWMNENEFETNVNRQIIGFVRK